MKKPTPLKSDVVEKKPDTASKIRLKIVGVGGAGGNAIHHIATVRAGNGQALNGVGLVAVNTDLQALESVLATEKVQIGAVMTHGLGAGGDVEQGARAALQDTERLQLVLQNTDVMFITAGLGGGTGSGAAPVIARLAKEQGALVLALVALPFSFEGQRRRQQADTALDQLRQHADAVLCIPNDRLFRLAGENANAAEAFRLSNDLIATGVQAIWQLVSRKGLINLDFADLRATLGAKHGDGAFSYGEGTGAAEAVKAVMSHPLMDADLLGKADAVLVSILGGPDLTLSDVQQVMDPISRQAGRAHIVMGAAMEEASAGKLSITVIAAANLPPRKPAAASLHRPLPAIATRTRTPEPTAVAAAPPKKNPTPPKQETLPLEGVTRGRFDKTEPTIYDGQDLDVPTFMRRGVVLKR